jgi:hypothetical protein
MQHPAVSVMVALARVVVVVLSVGVARSVLQEPRSNQGPRCYSLNY